MRWLLNLAYLLAGLVYLPVLVYQMVAQGKNRHGWGDRLGYVRLRPASRGRIWFHAVSLGEVNATPQLIDRLSRRFPDREIVVSCTTDTGYARACHLYGKQRVFRYPLDFSWMVGCVMDRVGADLIVLVELEVWPNLVALAAGRGVSVAVVNGRLTEHSARRLARLGALTRSMFGRLAWVGAQDQEIASRFRDMGVPQERVAVTGSLKWDTATVSDTVDGVDALAGALGIDSDRPLWVCGSTGPGEEAIILDAYRLLLDQGTSLRLAVVPRKPERFDEVARLIAQRSFGCVRRSERRDETSPPHPAETATVILGDTMGELRKFYALASVVFVGRSMVPMGGSDPMEVAALGKPVIAGPYMDNFQLPVWALGQRQALRTVATPDELAGEVARYCRDGEQARRAGEAARDVVIEHQGATDITVDALTKLIS